MQYGLIETEWGFFGFVESKGRLLATFLPAGQQAVRKAIRAKYSQAVEDEAVLPEFRDEVRRYFRGQAVNFSAAVDLSSLPMFRRKVLEACRRIPSGQVITYGGLASRVGDAQAARAVGSAMANNPLPIVIPCHRVLRSDYGLGGFSSPGGVSEKQRLLAMEGSWPVQARPSTVRQGKPRMRKTA